MRIDRMLSIVVILLNRRKITARELAERFEVSLRTVYRDVDAINDAGIPIVSSQGTGGGFSIMENYKLNHQLLTLEDTRTILTALKGVNSTIRGQGMAQAMEKIRSLVPGDKKEELDLKMEQLVIDYLPWGYNDEMQDRIQQLNKAIVNSHLVSINYINLKGEEKRRTVEPMTLMFKGYNWYLFGYCQLQKDGRLFRLSRIKELTLSDRTFLRRNISFKDFTKEKTDSSRPVVDLVFKFPISVRQRVEDYFYRGQIEDDGQGFLIVKASFPEDYWVYSFILSYGDNIEVLEPPHIREAIGEIAEKIMGKYQT